MPEIQMAQGNRWTIVPIRWLVEAAHVPKLLSQKRFPILGWGAVGCARPCGPHA